MKSGIFVLMTLFLLILQVYPRPVLLVTHPAEAFLNSYLHLVEKDLFPKCDLLFLAHEDEKKLIAETHRVMDLAKHIKYEFFLLHGYAQDRRFEDSSEKLTLLPNPEIKRFSNHPDASIPEQWTETFHHLFNSSDGYIIPGGADIPAAQYSRMQFIENTAPTALRSSYELAFLRLLLGGKDSPMVHKPRYLILGICLGSQSINVASGGTMWQSIPVELYGINYLEEQLKQSPEMMHKNYFLIQYPPIQNVYPGWFHRIIFTDSDKNLPVMDNVQVLSNHHQAIKTLGQGLTVTATSLDGKVIEVFNHRIFPNVIGVQFHPEREYYWNKLSILSSESRIFLTMFWKRMSELIKQNRLIRDLRKK